MDELSEAMPRGKVCRELFAKERGAQEMSLECEVLRDRAKVRQECLRALRSAETAHQALAFTRGLMAVFGPVVHPGAGFGEDVLDVCQLVDLGLRRRIAAQLIGHDLARHFGARGKHAPEKPLGCSLVATLLQQDVEFDAVLVDCAPQQVRLATQGEEHLVEMPCATRLAARRFHPMGKTRAELLAPAANRLVADRHTALEQQLFDVAQAELKAKVPAHRMADGRRQKRWPCIVRWIP